MLSYSLQLLCWDTSNTTAYVSGETKEKHQHVVLAKEGNKSPSQHQPMNGLSPLTFHFISNSLNAG